MSLRNFNQNSYGLSQALIGIFPSPIASQRAPTTADRGEVGQIWIDIPNNDAYIVTSVVAGSTAWQGIGGGAGTFNSLTVTNNITSTTGNIAATTGNVTAGGSISAGTSIASTTSITAGNGLTVTLGNATISAGNITVSNGSITAAGNFTSNTGDFTASNGDFICTTAETGVTLGGGARLICGTGSPDTAITAAKGSLYLRLDGSSTSTRAYINTDGATAWTAVTTAT